jgi:hypothetical protein
VELLATGDWPGNIRQNVSNVGVRQNVPLSQAPIIPVELVQQHARRHAEQAPLVRRGAGRVHAQLLSARNPADHPFCGNVSQAVARLAKRNRTDSASCGHATSCARRIQ